MFTFKRKVHVHYHRVSHCTSQVDIVLLYPYFVSVLLLYLISDYYIESGLDTSIW